MRMGFIMSEEISAHVASRHANKLDINLEKIDGLLAYVKELFLTDFKAANVKFSELADIKEPTARYLGTFVASVTFTVHVKPFIKLDNNTLIPAAWLIAECDGEELSAVQLINGQWGSLRGEKVKSYVEEDQAAYMLAHDFTERLISALFKKIPHEN